MILLDTSVYIEALRDKELESKIKEAAGKAVIMSSIVVEKEIDKAANFLRKTNRKDDAERLVKLYNLSAGGKIGLTPFVLKLSKEYENAVKGEFGRRKGEDMKEDFMIVSASSAAALAAIATFNRKTMANDGIIKIYRNVNEKYGLKTPRFIKDRRELIEFLLSL